MKKVQQQYFLALVTAACSMFLALVTVPSADAASPRVIFLPVLWIVVQV
jgi:hypothetical protein